LAPPTAEVVDTLKDGDTVTVHEDAVSVVLDITTEPTTSVLAPPPWPSGRPPWLP